MPHEIQPHFVLKRDNTYRDNWMRPGYRHRDRHVHRYMGAPFITPSVDTLKDGTETIRLGQGVYIAPGLHDERRYERAQPREPVYKRDKMPIGNEMRPQLSTKKPKWLPTNYSVVSSSCPPVSGVSTLGIIDKQISRKKPVSVTSYTHFIPDRIIDEGTVTYYRPSG